MRLVLGLCLCAWVGTCGGGCKGCPACLFCFRWVANSVFFLFGLFEERGGLQGGPKLMAHTFEEPLRKTSIWGY